MIQIFLTVEEEDGQETAGHCVAFYLIQICSTIQYLKLPYCTGRPIIWLNV